MGVGIINKRIAIIITKQGDKMKKFFTAVLISGIVLSLCGCGDGKPKQVKSVDTAMGTVVQQSIYSTEQDAGERSALTGEITSMLKSLEEQELSWRLESSEVFRMNESAGTEEGFLLSSRMQEILQHSLEVGSASEGAFDITMSPVVRLWDLDSWAAGERSGNYVLPETEALQQALNLCGSKRLRLEGNKAFLPTGMAIDLGAVGKGIAADKIHDFLRGNDKVTGAIISIGGTILTYGEKPDKTFWQVGVVNPLEPAEFIGILSLEGQWCVSTSGDYERYVEVDGVRYHHIIDPATGFPADSGVAGVTVLSKDGFLSDALSTACFVLGAEKGMQLAEQYNAEVLFVKRDGTVVMTEGMEKVYRGEYNDSCK